MAEVLMNQIPFARDEVAEGSRKYWSFFRRIGSSLCAWAISICDWSVSDMKQAPKMDNSIAAGARYSANVVSRSF